MILREKSTLHSQVELHMLPHEEKFYPYNLCISQHLENKSA